MDYRILLLDIIWLVIKQDLFKEIQTMVMFITIAWELPDSFETIIWLLNFYFAGTSYLNYQNPEIMLKIQDLTDYYDNGYLEDAIQVFHEIESLIFTGQHYPTVGYHLDSDLIHTHLLIMNNNVVSPLQDTAIRKALSFLIDRDHYITQMQTTYTHTLYQTSHLFGWSQYHDTSLPDIPHSISNAKSTLAKAGYRPCRIK